MDEFEKCFICGRNRHAGLEVHHIFQNAYRNKSEQYGATVVLCADCHRLGQFAAHRNGETMDYLHKYGQKKVMREHNLTVDEFREIFGQNYLGDEEILEVKE